MTEFKTTRLIDVNTFQPVVIISYGENNYLKFNLELAQDMKALSASPFLISDNNENITIYSIFDEKTFAFPNSALENIDEDTKKFLKEILDKSFQMTPENLIRGKEATTTCRNIGKTGNCVVLLLFKEMVNKNFDAIQAIESIKINHKIDIAKFGY